MQTKFKKGTVATATLAAAGVLMLAAPADVFAGFEWRAAPATPTLTTADILRNAATPPAQPPVQPAPVAVPQAMPAPVAPVTAVPVAPPAAMAAPRPQPAAPAPAPVAEAPSPDVIGGFGRDLPMVIALQQVVPAGYQFSFAPDVNPGALVSWEGGKPWQQVLGQMLAPLQIGYAVSGNVVNIGGRAAAPVTANATVAPTGPVAAEVPPALSLTNAVDQDEPPVLRRSGRRGAVATRRDVDPNRRSLFARIKDSFSSRPQKKQNEKAAEGDAPVSVLAKGDIDWKPADAQQAQQKPAAPAPVVHTPMTLNIAQEDTQVETAILPPVTLSAPVAPSAPVQPPAAPAVLDGFGRDLPLAIALMQIVPAGYDTAFADGVDQNAIVSWQGGKTWQHVLDETLNPQKLSFTIDGNIVRIKPVPAAVDAPLALTTPAPAEAAPVAAPAEPAVRGRRNTKAKADHDWTARMKNLFTFGDEKPAAQMPDAPATPSPVETAADIAPPPVATPVAEAPVPDFAMPVALPPAWTAAKGASLRDTLGKWGEAANVDLYWSIDYDYILNHDVAYGGNFDQAIGQLLGSMKSSRPQPYGRLHKVADGRDVLIIEVHPLQN